MNVFSILEDFEDSKNYGHVELVVFCLFCFTIFFCFFQMRCCLANSECLKFVLYNNNNTTINQHQQQCATTTQQPTNNNTTTTTHNNNTTTTTNKNKHTAIFKLNKNLQKKTNLECRFGISFYSGVVDVTIDEVFGNLQENFECNEQTQKVQRKSDEKDRAEQDGEITDCSIQSDNDRQDDTPPQNNSDLDDHATKQDLYKLRSKQQQQKKVSSVSRSIQSKL